MVLADADGHPLALDLSQGIHTLRMTLIQRKLNLDYILLVPAQ